MVAPFFGGPPLPKLIYIELGGRGEQIRIACAVAGMKFTDERITIPEFIMKKKSGELPTGTMPVWVEDGDTYFQAATILRLIGARNGMYSMDSNICWHIDSAMEHIEDVFSET